MVLSLTAAMAQTTKRKAPQKENAYVTTLAENDFDKLSLTDKQKKKVRKLNSTYKKRSSKSYQSKYDDEMDDLLSDAQYTKYKALKKNSKSNVRKRTASSSKKSNNGKNYKKTSKKKKVAKKRVIDRDDD